MPALRQALAKNTSLEVRRRIERKAVEKDFAKAMEKALALAKSQEAHYLPGWCGPSSDMT